MAHEIGAVFNAEDTVQRYLIQDGEGLEVAQEGPCSVGVMLYFRPIVPWAMVLYSAFHACGTLPEWQSRQRSKPRSRRAQSSMVESRPVQAVDDPT